MKLPLSSEPTPPEGAVIPLSPKNYDVKCLRCGAMNIPDNHICGKCGASLPVVYDRDGNIYRGQANPDLRLRLTRGPGQTVNPQSMGWFLRVALVLLAIFFAFYLFHHK